MARIVKETTIKASPDAVFAYVSDVTRHPEWGSHQNAVTARIPGPVKVGSVYDTINHQFGTQKELVTVTTCEPARKFYYESAGSLGLVDNGFDLTPAGDTTRVAKWMEIRKPTLLARLTGIMIKRNTPPALEEDLRRIKAKLEA